MDEPNWSQFACPNPKCHAFGQRGLPSIRPHGWSSKTQNIRCLRCTLCGKDCSERHGTAFFRCQLPEAKVLDIAQHIVEGMGMRATGRVCPVSLNTVLRVAVRTGEHAQAFHDAKVRHVHPPQVQADEAWALVEKKRQTR